MRQGMSRAGRQPQRGQKELAFGIFFFVCSRLCMAAENASIVF